MGDNKPYSVVVFTEENTVDVVATKWITDNGMAVYWPSKKEQSIPRLVMGLADPNDDWKKCLVIIEHSYGTYNLARRAAMKKADTGKDLDSEVTDREKERGKWHVTKKSYKKYFDDTKSEDYRDDPAIMLNNKKKKKAIVSSDSDDDKESLPLAQKSDVKERLKMLQQRKTSTSKNACISLSTQKNISDISTETNLPASNGSQKRKQIKTFIKSTSSKRALSPIKTSDKRSLESNLTFIDDNRFIEIPRSVVSNKNIPFWLTQQNADLSLSKKKISRNLSQLSPDNDSNEKWPHSPLKSTKDSVLYEREKYSIPQQGRSCSDSNIQNRKNTSSQSIYSTSSVKVLKELLQELNSKLDFIMIQNMGVMKKLYPEETVLKKLKDFPSLPLQSEDDFKNFEQFLQTENNLIRTADFFYALVSGCVLEHKAAGKLMRKCVSNRLSRMMSWGGTSKTKLNFNKSKLKEAIFCSLLKLYPESKLLNAEAAVKRWLNTSAQRIV